MFGAAFVIVLTTSSLIAFTLMPGMVRLLDRGGFTGINYQGLSIPSGVGILFPISALIPWLGLSVFTGNQVVFVWIAVIFGMSFIGLLDDAAGDRTTRGLKGHLRALIHRTPTTGSIKALIGGVLSLYAGWQLHGVWVPALLSGVLIALTTNIVNLLDVRPGRALKGFILLIVIATSSLVYSLPWSTLSSSESHLGFDHITAVAAPLGVAVALFSADLKAKIMIGDTGSNVLGASAGLLFSATPMMVQLVTLLVLVVLHVVAEQSSMTHWIEKVPILNRLDRWGRF